MMQRNGNGFAAVEEYYTQYGIRAKQLKAEGRKITGYLGALGPVEIMTAAGVVPLRLKGFANDPITKADAHMETIVCPFVRNVFDSVLKGKYDFLDGIVMPHQCDSVDRTNDVWSYSLALPYWHFLNAPHLADGPSIEFMGQVLRLFISTLEKFAGVRITNENLAQAVNDHNHNRRLMKELYYLRKSDPPLISGVEMTKILVAAMSLPVQESSSLIEGIIGEAKIRPAPAAKTRKRIMIVGDQIDNPAVAGIIEDAGAWLVMDDISMGSKVYWPEVDATPDPLQGIAEYYLRKVKLPTTYVADGTTYEENLNARFGHMKQFIKEFSIDGALLLVNKYCDPYGFEVPAIKSYVESTGTPLLYMEYEYSTSTLPRVKTRVEAFLEMIA
jgi:benzoyl-CoA reductase subunit C